MISGIRKVVRLVRLVIVVGIEVKLIWLVVVVLN